MRDIRIRLFNCYNNLYNSIKYLSNDPKKIIKLLNNNFINNKNLDDIIKLLNDKNNNYDSLDDIFDLLNNKKQDLDIYNEKIKYISVIKQFYKNIRKLSDFCDKYNDKIFDIIDIGYQKHKCKYKTLYFCLKDCHEYSREKKLFNDNKNRILYDCFYYFYKNYYFKYDSILRENKFFCDHNYILKDNEIMYSCILAFTIRSLDFKKRGIFCKLLKLILKDYDYKLFRNVFAYLYDDENKYIAYKTGSYNNFKEYDKSDYDFIDKYATDIFSENKYDSIFYDIIKM